MTDARLPELLEPCRGCAFWERPPLVGTPARNDTAAADKAAWLQRTATEWGIAGWVVRVDGIPAGQVFLAPAHLAPRALAFPTAPVSEDALVLLNLRVAQGYVGQGLGRVLVQTAARAALEHGQPAIEAFGTTRGEQCLTPASFLTAVGFRIVRDHPAYPRLRMDLRAAVGWRTDVERALERLLAPVRRLGGRTPVGTANHEATPRARP